MSTRILTPEERDLLAAEYALGVLGGEELAAAKSLAAENPEFRVHVARWSGRLGLLLDEVEPVEPPASLRERLQSLAAPPAANDNMAGKVALWRTVSAGMTALAAALALVLVVQQPRETQPAPGPAPVQVASAPMVAMLGDEQKPAAMVASWDPGSRRLMVVSAAEAAADPGHSHELWVIPADGTPRSLGVMPATKTVKMTLPDTVLGQMAEGSTLAVSVEPAGGSPTGAPTGPVIASGKLLSA